MLDKEHAEWLENRNARRAIAKKNGKKAPVPPKKPGAEEKREAPSDDQDGRIWRGEA